MHRQDKLHLVLIAFAFSLFTFSCTNDAVISKIDNLPEIPLLKEKLPDIHDKVDLSSFGEYDFRTTDGAEHHLVSYSVSENNTVQGYYMDLDGSQFYMSSNDEVYVYTNLMTDHQVVLSKIYDKEQNEMVPDLESMLVPTEPIDLNNLKSLGVCEDLCHIAYGVCSVGCIGVRVAGGVLLPGAPMVMTHLAMLCLQGCADARDYCLSLC